MSSNLLDIETKKLLKKFGAGSHKPGSGSAAAFNGLLSGNLIHTVICLTTEEKRKATYGNFFEELKEYDKEITEKILPRLEVLFEEDSVQFEKVIQLRESRNKSNIPIQKYEYEKHHHEALKIATSIPIEIAYLCIRLAEISTFVFTNGFQSARGDSFVAMSTAVSTVSGCISIIELNILSFHPDSWTQNILSEVSHLRNEFNKLNNLSSEYFNILKTEIEQRHFVIKQIDNIISSAKSNKQSNSEIEQIARDIQNILWKNRTAIWKENVPQEEIEILNSKKVLSKLLGYQFYKTEIIDENPSVAGIIDQNKKLVVISKKYPSETQNFTIAHELGHAILHTQSVLHRDRPIDGSESNPKNPQEYQADKFASYFLMPAKQTREIFKEFFFTDKFVLSEDNSFNLMQISPLNAKKELKELRALSRKLASTNSFGPNNFNSLSKIFGVSIEAMAIRLEELKLVIYE